MSDYRNLSAVPIELPDGAHFSATITPTDTTPITPSAGISATEEIGRRLWWGKRKVDTPSGTDYAADYFVQSGPRGRTAVGDYSGYLNNAYGGSGMSGEWLYDVFALAYGSGYNSTRPLPAGFPARMMRELLSETGVNHGQEADYNSTGDPYPEARWRFGYAGGPDFAQYNFDRKEWANPSGSLFDPIREIYTHTSAVPGTFTGQLSGLLTDTDDLSLSSFYNQTTNPGGWRDPWTPAASGYTPPPYAVGYEVLAPAEIVSAQLVVLGNWRYGSYRESGDRIVVGVTETSDAYAHLNDIIHGRSGAYTLGVLDAPVDTLDPSSSSGQLGDIAWTTIDVPVGIVPVASNVVLWYASSASMLMNNEFDLPPAYPGTTLPSVDTDPWSWRFAANHRTFPDETVDGHSQRPLVYVGFQYEVTPPVFRWITVPPPLTGRLKVKVTEGVGPSSWKYADPKPGENDGAGRLKVNVNPNGQPPQWIDFSDGQTL